jgi:hypothetical protein
MAIIGYKILIYIHKNDFDVKIIVENKLITASQQHFYECFSLFN